jgi:hypothetical protein
VKNQKKNEISFAFPRCSLFSPKEKVKHYFRQSKEKGRKIWNSQKKYLPLQRERRSQVEPRCAERWHLRDDEQFDLAAWFLSLK